MDGELARVLLFSAVATDFCHARLSFVYFAESWRGSSILGSFERPLPLPYLREMRPRYR
jgi:hypothetical protein